MRIGITPRSTIRASGASAVLAGLVVLLVATSGTVAHLNGHGPDGLIPLTDDAAARIEADLAAGVRLPGDLLCETDGPLAGVFPDNNPSSGYQGNLSISGLVVRVPDGVPIFVGETEGTIPFEDLMATPNGFPNFLGTEVSVSGLLELLPDDGTGRHATCTATFLSLVVGHPPFIGPVTRNDETGLYVNGIKVYPNPDPRIRPHVFMGDLAGRPLQPHEFPEGAFVTVNGDYNGDNNTLPALIIELDGIIPPQPGENDFISILRAEARTARNEVRVRGFSNNDTNPISLYDYSSGTKGILLASDIPVVAPDGVWDFRGAIPVVSTTDNGIPTHLLAETVNGGSATGPVSLR